MRLAGRSLMRLTPALLSEATITSTSRQQSNGVDALRHLLQQHRQGVEASEDATRVPPRTSAELPRTPHRAHQQHLAGCHPGATQGPDNTPGALNTPHAAATATSLVRHEDTAVLVKEMLRIFTRKVPGGLVPDDLIRGFMQAYRDLQSPQECLAFFQLLQNEMGLSVPEVTSAVRVWHSLPTRSPGGPAPHGAPSHPGSQPTSSFPPTSSPTPADPTSPLHPLPHPLDESVYRAADRLASACRPLYTQLFLPISQVQGGIKFLVDMRADMLALAERGEGGLRGTASGGAHLRAMADHLRQSLAEWFSVGLLQLQPLSWEHSPAALLERVMACEAVHPLASWADLRLRLGPSRAVFAFTHPCMPGEPLVVLHTALMDRPAAAMHDILQQQQEAPHPAINLHTDIPRRPAPPPPAGPSTAVFYSISASQRGLRGIDLGQLLIKRVAEQLRAEHPSIRQLVTLSPLPNFRAWLVSRLQQQQQHGGGCITDTHTASPAPRPPPPLLRPDEATTVLQLATDLGWRPPYNTTTIAAAAVDAVAAVTSSAASGPLAWLLEGDRWLAACPGAGGGPSGHQGPAAVVAGGGAAVSAEAVLCAVLLRLAAYYLMAEKRRRFALCPVAHFHLRNGASLWRLNWGADMSPQGLQRSFGIMVNYQYDLPNLYDNNRRYLVHHEVTADQQMRDQLSE